MSQAARLPACAELQPWAVKEGGGRSRRQPDERRWSPEALLDLRWTLVTGFRPLGAPIRLGPDCFEIFRPGRGAHWVFLTQLVDRNVASALSAAGGPRISALAAPLRFAASGESHSGTPPALEFRAEWRSDADHSWRTDRNSTGVREENDPKPSGKRRKVEGQRRRSPAPAAGAGSPVTCDNGRRRALMLPAVLVGAGQPPAPTLHHQLLHRQYPGAPVWPEKGRGMCCPGAEE